MSGPPPPRGRNAGLNQAQRAKYNEFYTQLTDIEKELRHYTAHFRDKVVYCNCDDPRASKFFKYFQLKFRALGLRKLITTCYKNQNPDLFSRHDAEGSVGLAITERDGENGDLPDIDLFQLDGDGDFRSAESIALLEQADIVVTNPPFSLFKEYVAQLIEHDKQFLVIGSQNAITYKEIFPLIKDGRVWFGPSIKSGHRTFGVPDHHPLDTTSSWADDDGNKFTKVDGVRWFTNLDHAQRHEDLILYRRYKPEDYSRYDNYDAINVDKVAEIPVDFDGAMGVPISFLNKYNPDQFEILGATESEGKGFSGGLWKSESGVAQPVVGGSKKYKRLFIRNRNPQS